MRTMIRSGSSSPLGCVFRGSHDDAGQGAESAAPVKSVPVGLCRRCLSFRLGDADYCDVRGFGEVHDGLHSIARFGIVVRVARQRHGRDDRIKDHQHDVADSFCLGNKRGHVGCGIKRP